MLFLIKPDTNLREKCNTFIISFARIPGRLNFMCRRFGTLCSIFIGGVIRKNNQDELYPSNIVPVIPLAYTTCEDGTDFSETSAHKFLPLHRACCFNYSSNIPTHAHTIYTL
jgi:hypothetical protein